MKSALGLLFLLFAQISSALKFDIVAGKGERCIRNFVLKDQLVVVTAIVSGDRGDGQMVNMHVRWSAMLSIFLVSCTIDGGGIPARGTGLLLAGLHR
jgi:hypothetical protein